MSVAKEENFSITNETKGRLPSLPFVNMKEKVLGKEYSLSLIFVNTEKIRALNNTYRKIDSPTDILSFPINEKEGEIYICKEISDKKSKEFERDEINYLKFVFIHGLVHLLGHDHGKEMEAIEEINRNYFQI